MNNKYEGFSFDVPKNENGESFKFETNQINENIIKTLKSTKPWLTLSAITCLLIFLGSMAISVFDYYFKAREPFVIPAEIVSYSIILSVIFSLFYAIPSICLLRYSSSIKKVINSREIGDLEIALKRQKSLWLTVGILILLPFAITMIGIAVMFVMASKGMI